MGSIDEKLLVQEILSGNRETFVKLVRQYEALVLHIVTPLIGVTADREDICQDVFIKVYQKLDTFQFRSKLSTWIGNIAFNTTMNFLTRKRNVLIGDLYGDNSLEESSWEQKDPGQDDANPENLLIDKENVHHLIAAIDALPGIQKTVILLFHQEELTLIEIAEIMSIPPNTIKSHLFRARKTLKNILSP